MNDLTRAQASAQLVTFIAQHDGFPISALGIPRRDVARE
jgi:hypothetical protein